MEFLDITTENTEPATGDYFVWLAEHWGADTQPEDEGDEDTSVGGRPNDMGGNLSPIPYGALDDSELVYSDCGLPGVEIVATADFAPAADAGGIPADFAGASNGDFAAAA